LRDVQESSLLVREGDLRSGILLKRSIEMGKCEIRKVHKSLNDVYFAFALELH